jgi:undecaprenyl diphosphate synthase
MELLETTLKEEFVNFVKEGIRFRVIGNRELLPEHIRTLIEEVENATRHNNKMILQSALSYSGRDEILRVVKRALELKIPPQALSEETIDNLLDTAGVPDPDLIIRTSGEQRISNFLLWQSAYSEFYFTPTLWPDFTKEELLDAIQDYRVRDRRFGKVPSGAV